MRLLILSDTHFEHRTRFQDSTPKSVEQTGLTPGPAKPSLIHQNNDADMIVLAGDIHTGTKGIEWAIAESDSLNTPFIYVLGNHEFYGHDHRKLLNETKVLTKGTRVYLLENESMVIDGVRFLGCTLWTDYRAYHNCSQEEAMAEAERFINDHRVIRFGGRPFFPRDALNLHQGSRDWLSKQLARPFNGKTVVVTHHGPSPACQDESYELSPITSAFWSDLGHLIEKPDLWIYGHTHRSLDTDVRGTRLVSNQQGYPGETETGYQDGLVIDTDQYAK